MLKKLLLSKQKPMQLMVVLIGSFIGFTLILTTIQMSIDIKQLFSNNSDLIGSQVLVINKPVSLANTLLGAKNTFEEKELIELEKIKGIEKVGIFNSNLYRAKTAFSFMDNAMYTDIFFESIPDEFIDFNDNKWNWREGKEVPIILPTDYLNLYNFGFAPSQNLPQISQNTAQLAGLKIKIEGRGQIKEYDAKIWGFTNRINSILVPEKFLEYTNNQFGEKQSNGSSRVALLCKDPSNPTIYKYLKEKGYETNQENLKNSKLNSLLQTITGIVLGIGILIIILSLLGFIQYSQLLISDSSEEIKTLLLIGYPPKIIIKNYFLYYLIILTSVIVLSFLSLAFIQHFVNQYMSHKGFELNSSIHFEVIVYGILLSIILSLINLMSISKKIIQLAKS